MMRKLRSWTCLLVMVGVVSVCLAKDTIPIPNTPEGTVETITKSMAEFKPQVMWSALPSKYQSDIKSLIGLFAENMDQEVYDKGVATLDKLADILKNKKEFIANNPLVKQQLEQNKVDADDFNTSLDSASKIIGTLTKSDLASVAKLKTLDPEKFLATTCSKLMKDSYEIAQTFDKDEKLPDIESMKKVTVKLIEKSDDKAKVSVDKDGDGDDEEPKEETLVLVDGKWVPEEMAADWDKKIESATTALKAMKITPESKTQALMAFGMIDGILTGLADAKTQQDFDKALMGILMLMPGGPGGGPGGPGGPPPGVIPGN